MSKPVTKTSRKKKDLGTIEYHPFSQLPATVVSFPIEEDMREIVPGNYPKTKISRRNRARQLMGPELFDTFAKENEQIGYNVVEEYQQKEREKERAEFRELLAKLDKEEQEQKEHQQKIDLIKKQLEEKAKRMAEMEELWMSESTTPHPSSQRKPLPRWTNGGRRHRTNSYKLKHQIRK